MKLRSPVNAIQNWYSPFYFREFFFRAFLSRLFFFATLFYTPPPPFFRDFDRGLRTRVVQHVRKMASSTPSSSTEDAVKGVKWLYIRIKGGLMSITSWLVSAYDFYSLVVKNKTNEQGHGYLGSPAQKAGGPHSIKNGLCELFGLEC